MLRLLVAALACASLVFAADSEEEHIRKSVPVSSATRLVLNVDAGSIHLQPGNEKTVDVDVYFHGSRPSRGDRERLRREYTLDVAQQGSEIHVTGNFRDGPDQFFGIFRFFTWPREVEYRVTVPKNFNADVATAGGPIAVSDLQGQVHARTSGGPISLEGVEGDVDVSTSGGPISIERNAGRVRAHTSGGPIAINESRGAIDASTSGGPVSATLLGQPKEDCRLSTSGGNIDVRLSRDIHMDLDAATGGGRVSTDFPVTISGERNPGELRAALNGGGPRLYLRTSGGGIRVHHAD